MTKQTAVEWLINYIGKEEGAFTKGYIIRLLEQSKEMEKKQIMDAFENGENKSAELYYNETYGGKQ